VPWVTDCPPHVDRFGQVRQPLAKARRSAVAAVPRAPAGSGGARVSDALEKVVPWWETAARLDGAAGLGKVAPHGLGWG